MPIPLKEKISGYEKATVDYTGDKLYVGQYEEKAPETEAAEPQDKDTTENSEKEKEKEKLIKQNIMGQLQVLV